MATLATVVVVIPTYNESMTIATTLAALQQERANLTNHQLKVLIFDSCSTDDTVTAVTALQQRYNNIVLVEEAQKSGLGSAYIQAMQYAMETLNADIICEFDADGSHQPKYLPDMLAHFEQGADVVVGSRYVKGGEIPKDWGWHRKLLSIGGNWMARLVLTPRYRDFTSGYRATRTALLRQVDLNNLLSKNYAYKLHLMWALHKLGAKIIEHPIIFIDREKGVSKFPRNNAIESLILIWCLRLREVKRYLKVCCVGASGALIQLLIFNLFHAWWSTPLTANTIAIECAIASNFILNNYFSFSKQRFHFTRKPWQIFKKFLLFNVTSLGSMLIQLLVLATGLHLIGHTTARANFLVIVGIFIGSLYNYYVYSKWIWKQSS
ncbi:MAG: glycosyltransferase family 2 protein [Gammaproteobacteria bacterium]|nr:glycosyltransferase family 2 protein [Gammaproteobacteria bacterium]